LGYNFGEDLVSDFVFNFTDWLEGNGSFATNLVDWGQDSFDSLIEYGIAQWNFWAGWLPLPPLPGILATGQQAKIALGAAPQSPVGDITAALVAANRKFFDLTAAVTEAGLFKLAEPVLRDLKLGLVADQIDINYFDLLKPATIQEVDGIGELLTVPDRFLTDLKKGVRPLQALGQESEYVADRLVTRVGNAGKVVEVYVDKQVDYFTNGLPTPPNGKLNTTAEKTITRGPLGASVSLSNAGKDPLKKVIRSFKASSDGNVASSDEKSAQPRPIKTAIKDLASKAKTLRDGAKSSLGRSHSKVKDPAPK
jgi:hypothetical protein